MNGPVKNQVDIYVKGGRVRLLEYHKFVYTI